MIAFCGGSHLQAERDCLLSPYRLVSVFGFRSQNRTQGRKAPMGSEKRRRLDLEWRLLLQSVPFVRHEKWVRHGMPKQLGSHDLARLQSIGIPSND